eukprot:3677471-Prymnesium_polylepis.1
MPPCWRAPRRPFTCGHRRTSAARAARCLECESSGRPNLSCGSSPPVRHYSSVSRPYDGAAH